MCRLAAAVAILAAVSLVAANSHGDEHPMPITKQRWQEVVISVSDIDTTARFFLEIGGYEVKWRGPMASSAAAAWGLPTDARGEAALIGPEPYETGLIRLIRFDNAGGKL